MIQSRAPYLKGSIAQKNSFRVSFLSGNFRLRLAGLNEIAVDLLLVQFDDFKSRRALANPVPVDSADEAHDVICRSRRTKDAARREIADPGTEQPNETGDVVDVSMTDKNVGDLMRNSRGQPAFTQIEQKAAPLVL